MDSLLILADLGRVKAYRVTRDEDQPGTSPAFQDVADVDLENQHSKVSDRVTDQAGRFDYGAGSVSVGERHNEEQEARRNQLEAIATQIDRLAGAESGRIYLAAPKTMLRQLLDALGGSTRQRIKKELPLDLVKAPKLELLERFALA